jgi:hypothetical protein
LVVLTLHMIFSNVKRRKKILVDSPKSIGKASVKVGKDTAKSIGKTWSNLKSKKPQLPGGVGHKTNSTPAITTPEKVPKQGGIIPITVNSIPSQGTSDIEFVYMETCRGYTIFDEGPSGESLAFKCVGGKDKKGNYKIWFYDVRYHTDSRKKESNQRNDYSYYSSA